MSPAEQNINILVVDDEEIVVSLVRDALEDEFYNLKTANNGMEALEILGNDAIDLLITDIRMSPMNGIDLAQKIREKHPDASVIFMTGYANLNSAKDAIRQGAIDYILKPFELNEIRQAVKKAVDKIKKDIDKKSSAEQLDSLSDLNQLLYTVGDKKSLLNISLKFAIMHLKGICGSVIFWNNDKTEFRIHNHKDNDLKMDIISDPNIIEFLKNYDYKTFVNPRIIDSTGDDSLNIFYSKAYICPRNNDHKCQLGELRFVAIPIRRAETIYGIILVAIDANATSTFNSDLKLLAITASQLALSIENVVLLEETQSAYEKLQELQHETIELEKMAAKGEISAEIGHELNNFLGVVAGNLSLMEVQIQKQNYDKINKYLLGMKENIEKIKKFTSNLMDLRSISSQKEIVYFDKLIVDVIEYLKPQKRFDCIKIKFNPCPDELPFSADNTHIQQLLYNLFNNAADATQNRSRREISVTTSLKEAEDKFNVVIEDTGAGFEPEFLKRAFQEKFTTKTNGHGFGLLVCKRIIDNHGGSLSINSIPNHGTSISIDFPLYRKNVLEPASFN